MQHKLACTRKLVHRKLFTKDLGMMKFWIYKEEGLYNLCSENKGDDQLLHIFVFTYVISWFSHDAA